MAPVAPPSIGPKLRKARIDRSLSIEETAWRTRIRPDLLRALEDERFDVIGQQSLVRRNLSSYARFLGMDPTEVVEEFTSRQGEPEPSSIEELDRKNREAPKPKRPKWLIAAIASGVALAVAAGVGALGGQTERPTAKTSTPPTTARASQVPSSRVVAPVSPARARVTLVVVALSPTLVSIQADGSQIFDRTLAAGESRTFRARSTIDLVAADGGTVRLTLNGVDLGRPGPSGSVFRARYGPKGKIAPA
ncbi:MAG TPA: RodZ domain-containing protein [Actinomycetota bacterium]|nr:RodZ domain-containing protein [Actinomycetota bacterium]